MTAKTERYAAYKGKTYRLEFLGETKFGKRAKLSFLDGTKEFWVAAELVRETSAPASTMSCQSDRKSVV